MNSTVMHGRPSQMPPMKSVTVILFKKDYLSFTSSTCPCIVAILIRERCNLFDNAINAPFIPDNAK